MKNKRNINNFLFSGLVLFSILFQSFHSYAHLLEQIEKEICFHEHSENEADLTHAHAALENCFVCHFSFSPFESTESFSLLFNLSAAIVSPNFVCYQKVNLLYKGSLFALRAPPTV